MTETLTTALERRTEPKEQTDFRDLLERMRPELVKSLQRDDVAEMLLRHYLTAYRLNPKLAACSNDSKLAALLLSAQVRLEPGPLGHVYLVPFKGEVNWILGYTGLLELARRSERVAALRARVVWNCDAARVWEDERGEHYTFEEGDESGREERLYVVVTWKELAGGKWFPRVVKVPKSRIERAKQASPAFRNNSGPWLSDEDAMWCKTGIRAVRPWLPLSTEAGYAIASDDAVAVGIDVDQTGAAQPSLMARDEEGEGGDQ